MVVAVAQENLRLVPDQPGVIADQRVKNIPVRPGRAPELKEKPLGLVELFQRGPCRFVQKLLLDRFNSSWMVMTKWSPRKMLTCSNVSSFSSLK